MYTVRATSRLLFLSFWKEMCIFVTFVTERAFRHFLATVKVAEKEALDFNKNRTLDFTDSSTDTQPLPNEAERTG